MEIKSTLVSLLIFGIFCISAVNAYKRRVPLCPPSNEKSTLPKCICEDGSTRVCTIGQYCLRKSSTSDPKVTNYTCSDVPACPNDETTAVNEPCDCTNTICQIGEYCKGNTCETPAPAPLPECPSPFSGSSISTNCNCAGSGIECTAGQYCYEERSPISGNDSMNYYCSDNPPCPFDGKTLCSESCVCLGVYNPSQTCVSGQYCLSIFHGSTLMTYCNKYPNCQFSDNNLIADTDCMCFATECKKGQKCAFANGTTYCT